MGVRRRRRVGRKPVAWERISAVVLDAPVIDIPDAEDESAGGEGR
jgi:hypothetical protein